MNTEDADRNTWHFINGADVLSGQVPQRTHLPFMRFVYRAVRPFPN